MLPIQTRRHARLFSSFTTLIPSLPVPPSLPSSSSFPCLPLCLPLCLPPPPPCLLIQSHLPALALARERVAGPEARASASYLSADRHGAVEARPAGSAAAGVRGHAGAVVAAAPHHVVHALAALRCPPPALPLLPPLVVGHAGTVAHVRVLHQHACQARGQVHRRRPAVAGAVELEDAGARDPGLPCSPPLPAHQVPLVRVDVALPALPNEEGRCPLVSRWPPHARPVVDPEPAVRLHRRVHVTAVEVRVLEDAVGPLPGRDCAHGAAVPALEAAAAAAPTSIAGGRERMGRQQRAGKAGAGGGKRRRWWWAAVVGKGKALGSRVG